jgi:hypothetical protein
MAVFAVARVRFGKAILGEPALAPLRVENVAGFVGGGA